MVRILASIATFAALASSCAFAQEAKPAAPVLTIRDVIGISNGLDRMKCEKKIIRSGSQEIVDCVPYPASIMKAGLAWQAMENQRKAMMIVQDYQRHINQHLAALPRESHNEAGDLTITANAQFQLYQADLLDKPAFLPGETLVHFKKSEIDPLNLPVDVLTWLRPIIDESP
jgi:hypothetical protein